MAGEGNPWAQFGAPPDPGTGQPQPGTDGAAGVTGQDGKAPETVQISAADWAKVQTDLKSANERLAKLPEGFEGMGKKIEIVDRLVKAFAGEGEGEKYDKEYRAVFGDLKEVARRVSPGLHKLMVMLEQNPNAVDQFTQSMDVLHAERIVSLNTQAHQRALQVAKDLGMRASSPERLAQMVMPFEATITRIIDSNQDLQRKFLSGDVSVIDDVFKKLYTPYTEENLARKQALTRREFPKAPPRGGAGQAAGKEGEPQRPDIRTAKGKMDFHRAAVNRWLDRASRGNEE